MSAKTKIVVLHMKELIYTGIFAVLGILLVILLIMMFTPDKKDSKKNENERKENTPTSESGIAETASIYIPGVYTTELVLGAESIDVEVIVDKDSVTSIRMVNLDEAVTTMYPLLQPTLDSICEQIYDQQSLESVTYSSDSKYTSLVLLEAIQTSLDKARADKSGQ